MPTGLVFTEGNSFANENAMLAKHPARSKARRMCENSLRENRESSAVPVADVAAGRLAKATGRTASMHAAEQSDGCVVPAKQPNKGGPVKPPAEVVEGRQPALGNVPQTATPRTLCRFGVLIGLRCVRKALEKSDFAPST